MKIIKSFLLIFLFLSFMSCNDINSSDGASALGDWLIPKEEVFDGGPGRDGIPSVDQPNFVSVSSAGSFLADDDLVVGIKIGRVIKAYPHIILDWHEIVNDDVSGQPVAVTYCPLTGSAIGWNRKLADGSVTTFGVSGFLYNTNLIPYDRKTQSNWSQMRLECVNGPLITQTPSTNRIIETTFRTWKKLYPGSVVMDRQTGVNRPYGTYPYGDYKTNNDNLLFPVKGDDSRLPRKVRVFGIIAAGQSEVFKINAFGTGINVINDNFNSRSLVVIGSTDLNVSAAYESKLSDGTVLEFTAVQDQLPVVMTDSEGNKWDIFGNAVSGPREGTQLNSTESFTAYWFAWAAFYPNATIKN